MDTKKRKINNLLALFGLFAFLAAVYYGYFYFLSQKSKKQMPSSSQAEIKTIQKNPHDASFFTEGFLYDTDSGCFYESSGLYQKSFLIRSDGMQDIAPSDIFMEGCTIIDDRLYGLTYQEHKAYVKDKNSFQTIQESDYPREGWGLTTDGTSLISSDGSDTLFFMDKEWNLVKTISVTENGNPVTQLNELEYVEGIIFANVWTKNDIILISPETGNVLKRINCSSFMENAYTKYLAENRIRIFQKNMDVMNGIAWDGTFLYLTGKYWPYVYVTDISGLLAEFLPDEDSPT